MAMADVGALIERAERCVDTFELPLALKFYERALAFEPDNCALLDATGELLLRLGEAERAVAVLEKSVSLAPNANFAAYLNLGQLQSGTAAVQRFEQGVELLRARERALRKRAAKVKAMAGVEARDELSVVQQQICSALCAIAEARAHRRPSRDRARPRLHFLTRYAPLVANSEPDARNAALATARRPRRST